ncbi:transcriptional regulator ArsR family [Clostridium aceticum]|uniref:Transcriptional regulator ArsR family n=1 Tax=Clostridium aceticum TaxID=84022 RepID=A0A0D8IAA8_9CLOT|nr:metalloregulator ArsR/SmtB family transcription factor [Clostridium aceticum]AKL96375.1 transcriptional regulator ArsR family [Clostridium aceticum]KJF26957.1 hypothetical protein TZ02_10530 [Clostridium aceticum]
MDEFMGKLKALADETRFKVIQLLLTHDYCVGALAKQLNISEAAVSQHLQILRKAGVVKGEKRGYFTHYVVDREILKKVAEDIIKEASRMPQEKNKCQKHKVGKKQCCKML